MVLARGVTDGSSRNILGYHSDCTKYRHHLGDGRRLHQLRLFLGDLCHPTQGFREIVIFNITSADMWDIYSFHTIGLHNWRAGAAGDVADMDRAQNSPYSELSVLKCRRNDTRSYRMIRRTIASAAAAVAVAALLPLGGSAARPGPVTLQSRLAAKSGAAAAGTCNLSIRPVSPSASRTWLCRAR